MAAAAHRAFFSVNTYSLSSRLLLVPSVSLKPPGAPKTSSAANKIHHHVKLKHSPRASSEGGAPSELIEDSKFVPLNQDDMIFGPPALLLLGFEVEEAGKIQEFLRQLDGEFLKVIYCTEDMISRSLWDAMNASQPNLEELKIAKGLPRICFFSGLSGEEMMLFIESFPKAGLEPAVFAALVPNSADKLLEELIQEIMEDHEMLTEKGKENA